MDTSRLEAFSDGVFAVAITLLVFNLAVPGPGGPGKREPSLAAQLGGHWPAFAAYAVSFATIGIIWVNHHMLFGNFTKIDRTLLFLNLLLLFFVVSIPFATSTFADYLRQGNFDASLAAAIYQGVYVGMSVSFGGLFWWSIRHEHMKIAFTSEGARRAVARFGIGLLAYVVAVGIAFVSATASLIITGLVAIYYIFEQTPAFESSLPPEPPDQPVSQLGPQPGQPQLTGRLPGSLVPPGRWVRAPLPADIGGGTGSDLEGGTRADAGDIVRAAWTQGVRVLIADLTATVRTVCRPAGVGRHL